MAQLVTSRSSKLTITQFSVAPLAIGRIKKLNPRLIFLWFYTLYPMTILSVSKKKLWLQTRSFNTQH